MKSLEELEKELKKLEERTGLTEKGAKAFGKIIKDSKKIFINPDTIIDPVRFRKALEYIPGGSKIEYKGKHGTYLTYSYRVGYYETSDEWHTICKLAAFDRYLEKAKEVEKIKKEKKTKQEIEEKEKKIVKLLRTGLAVLGNASEQFYSNWVQLFPNETRRFENITRGKKENIYKLRLKIFDYMYRRALRGADVAIKEKEDLLAEEFIELAKKIDKQKEEYKKSIESSSYK